MDKSFGKSREPSRLDTLRDYVSYSNSSRPTSSVRLKRENTNRVVRSNRLVKPKLTPSSNIDYLAAENRLIREANGLLNKNKYRYINQSNFIENKVVNLSDYEDPQIKLKLITNLNPFLNDENIDPDSEETKQTLKATLHCSLIKDYEISGIKPILERPKFTPSPDYKMIKYDLVTESSDSNYNERNYSSLSGNFILCYK